MSAYKPYWDRQKGILARHGADPTISRWLNQSLAACVTAMYADERAHEPMDLDALKELVRTYVTGFPT